MQRKLSAIGLALPLALLAACADTDSLPLEPGAVASVRQEAGRGKTSLDLIEEDVAAGALDRASANLYRAYAVFDPARLPARYRSSERGKDATLSMVLMARDWDRLSPATRQEILDIQAKGFADLKETVETSHFVLHYTDQGNNAVPPVDANANGVSDFIDAAAESWERIWRRELVELGYPAPLGTPALKFHAYYKDILYYGYTVADNVELLATSPVPLGIGSAYIVVENDFYGFPPNDVDVTGTEPVRVGALQVTQAHEFMHASQFNINLYQSGWLFESHATWAEDAVYAGRGAARRIRRNLGGRQAIRSRRVRAGHLGLHTGRALGDSTPAQRDPSDARRVSRGRHRGPRHEPDAEPRALGPGRELHRVRPRGRGGSLAVSFDGMDGYAWRALLVMTPANGHAAPSVAEITLGAGSAGGATVSGFGTRWGKVTLVPTIADRPGEAVPFSYAADIQ
jgi:hypothetical protein